MIATGMNDLYGSIGAHFVIVPNGAMELAAVVQTRVDVSQEVGGRDRRSGSVHFDRDHPHFGLEHDDRQRWRCRR
jgi:hypothetical protein